MMERPTNYSRNSYKHYFAPYDASDIDDYEATSHFHEQLVLDHLRGMWRSICRFVFIVGLLLGAGVVALLLK